MKYLAETGDFVPQGSIVRRIWGDEDTILLVFAGSAAEFALNRAVDWLFFTGRLPSDPIGRFFSTAAYAQRIVFADVGSATRAFAGIRAAHAKVESDRGASIPDWAYRDVLYMLIDYSERAHAVLYRPLSAVEREDLYDVFRRVGEGIGVEKLPAAYADWRLDRELHMRRDLIVSDGSRALYAAYREHLGPWRYLLLRMLQSVLVPRHVRRLLGLRRALPLRALLPVYPLLVRLGMRPMIQRMLMPPRYLEALALEPA